MPDATGLELIAQELRDRDADGVLDTTYFRDKAAITVRMLLTHRGGLEAFFGFVEERRGVGGIFALASSRGYWQTASRGHEPHSKLKKLFPAGMYSTDETRERLWNDLGSADWPREGLYICAVDLFSGELVPLRVTVKLSPARPPPEIPPKAPVPGVAAVEPTEIDTLNI